VIRLKFLALLFIFSAYHVNAQIWNKLNPLKKEETAVAAPPPSLSEEEMRQLRNDINALASEKMEGRKAGTKGEQLAAEYIEKRMQSLGLFPPIGKSFRRPFKFPVGREVSQESKITVNGKITLIPYEAIPLSFSAPTADENYVLPESEEPNNIWLEPLYASPAEAQSAAFDWEKSIYERAKKAAERGATSVIFYDSYGSNNPPVYKRQSDYTALTVPVWFVTKKVYDEHIRDMKTMRPVVLNTKFKTEYGNGINLAGFINNGAKSTGIIAAHYDHRGTGKNLYAGADDNASGVAALFALAAKIRTAKFTTYNYLFMTFSAEEEGALGSKAFVEERDYKGKSIAYMINLDKIGRMDADKTLAIAGLGTAPEFKGLIGSTPSSFRLIKENLGKSESDHKTFYDNGVPFLYFSTGDNPDSGTPDDVAGKINFRGMADITQYIFSIISGMEKQPMPIFTKTKDEAAPQITEQPKRLVNNTGTGKETGSRTAGKKVTTPKTAVATKQTVAVNQVKATAVANQAKTTSSQANNGNPVFKVSLGISPDLEYGEGGVKIATVSVGRAAAKAGLQAGDIIIQMKDLPIQTYDNYMEALTKFDKGNKVMVKIKRNGRIQQFPVVFQ